MEEILDVVDDSNSVIGQAPRDEVHQEGLQHRSSHIFVFNPQSEIYIQKRSRNKKNHPLFYDSSAAGHLQQGEAYEPCAVRELEEEIGIIEPNLFPVDIVKTSDGSSIEHAMLFLCRTDQPVRTNPIEVASGTFISLKRLDEWINQEGEQFTPAFHTLYKTFRQEINRWLTRR